MIKGLDHVTILVKDLDGALAQYKHLLGMQDRPPPTVRRMEPRPNQGFRGTVLNFPSTYPYFEFITPTDDHGPWARRLAANGDGVYLVCVSVDNLRETVEELRGKGARLVGDPGPGTGPIDNYVLIHPRSAYGVQILLLEK